MFIELGMHHDYCSIEIRIIIKYLGQISCETETFHMQIMSTYKIKFEMMSVNNTVELK